MSMTRAWCKRSCGGSRLDHHQEVCPRCLAESVPPTPGEPFAALRRGEEQAALDALEQWLDRNPDPLSSCPIKALELVVDLVRVECEAGADPAYVGVPPGRNARAWVSVRAHGGERVLYDEGWPEKQRTGRKIGRQAVKIRWQGDKLSLLESDRVLWETQWPRFGFPQAYLYLQMSSHSNYPAREVFFDHVQVRKPGAVSHL